MTPATTPAHHERQYARTVRRALRTVPHYRERQSADGALPPLTRDEAEARRHLLMPLGAALLPRRDPGPRPAGEHIAELYEALCLAGRRPRRGAEVYETARSLRDPVRAYGVTWRVVLSPAAETDPYYRDPLREHHPDHPDHLDHADHPDRAVPSGRQALVIADTDTDTDAGAPTVPRLSLAGSDGAHPRGALWHEPWLGHLGAVPPSCGELHLNPARVHARLLDGVTVLTLLRHRRPTLVHVRPEGAELFRPESCPRHGRPILRRERSSP
ncbi:hypothetical protein [Streptomyces katsurahamanus]|uniref:Uncharacterized protein n=1 Tax=Streptomyces katsurahamanus TaxID=2577098 RepID=A0ABW9NW50_9ACTN|nr:hypothetical protein [Streptomyces katsurahamanus]MQS37517.1 hypothetical protein [Streptomyces katsurahamanus]